MVEDTRKWAGKGKIFTTQVRYSRSHRRHAMTFRNNLILPVLFKVDNTLEVASEIK
jgi:hypothetical protein